MRIINYLLFVFVLFVSISLVSSQVSETKFTISRSDGCYRYNSLAALIIDGSVTIIDADTPNACNLHIGGCCPIGFSCQKDIDRGNDYYCVYNSSAIGRCSDYGEDECDDDPDDIAESDPLCHSIIIPSACSDNMFTKGYYLSSSSCECEWVGSSCNLKQNQSGSSTTNPLDVFFTCFSSTVSSGCTDGKMNIVTNSTITWNNQDVKRFVEDPQNHCNALSFCPSGTKDITCGRPVAKLGFFGFYNFIISFILIGVLYFVYRRKFIR